MNSSISDLSLAWFVMMSIALSIIDLRIHRLPNHLVALTTFGFLAIGIQTLSRYEFETSIFYGALYLGIFTILKIIGKSAIGMGDVKYAFACGAVIGAYDPQKWLINIWLMFAVASMVMLAKRVFSRISLKDRFAFGPYMASATILMSLNSLRTVLA